MRMTVQIATFQIVHVGTVMMKMNTTVNDDSSWEMGKYSKFYRVIQNVEKLERLGSLMLMLHWRIPTGC